MADILLFHHVLGLTGGVGALADRLRAAGHRVETPDLFGGRTFASIEEGAAHAEEIGFETVIERGVAAAEGFGRSYVTMGLSLGVLPAQKLAQTDPGVTAALLCHSAVSPEALGSAWRAGVGVQIHLVEDDPWVEEDLPAARALADSAGGELHLSTGTAHLVLEEGHPDWSPAIGDQIVERILGFV